MRESVELNSFDVPLIQKTIKELKIEEKDTRLDIIKRLIEERDYAKFETKNQIDELINYIKNILEPAGILKLYDDLKNKEYYERIKNERNYEKQQARSYRNYYFSKFRPYGEVCHQVRHQGKLCCIHEIIGPVELNSDECFPASNKGKPKHRGYVDCNQLDSVKYFITVEHAEDIDEYIICDECFKKSYVNLRGSFLRKNGDNWIFPDEFLDDKPSNNSLPDITSIKIGNINRWDNTNELEPTNYYLKNFGFCFWRLKR